MKVIKAIPLDGDVEPGVHDIKEKTPTVVYTRMK